MIYKEKLSMVISQNFISLIVKREALERKEKGLSQKVIDSYNLDKIYYDRNLIAIPGAMNPFDMEEVVADFEKKHGLKFLDEKERAVDFVVIDAFFGVTTRCDWLENCCKEESVKIGNKEYPAYRAYKYILNNTKKKNAIIKLKQFDRCRHTNKSV